MAEYIERGTLLKDISETVLFTVREGAKLPTTEMRGANKVIDQIKSAPTADVVEVVRCKDCKYCEVFYLLKKIGEEPIKGHCCKLYHSYKEPTDFCSYGEREESV